MMDPCVCGFDFWGTVAGTAFGILIGGLMLAGAVWAFNRYG